MVFKRFILLIISSISIFAESGVGININKYDLELEGTIDSRNLEMMEGNPSIFLGDFNLINVDKDNRSDKLIGIGIGATNKFEAVEGVELTFGVRLILSSIDNKDKCIDDWFSAVPLFASIRYRFPPLMYDIPPVALEGKLAYAPSSLTFGDANNYSELKLSGDIEMIPNVRVYAGYRHIITGFEFDKDYLFSNGLYGGLKFIY